MYVAGNSMYSWGSPVNPHADPNSYDAFAAKLVPSAPLIPTMTGRGLMIFAMVLVG